MKAATSMVIKFFTTMGVTVPCCKNVMFLCMMTRFRPAIIKKIQKERDQLLLLRHKNRISKSESLFQKRIPNL